MPVKTKAAPKKAAAKKATAKTKKVAAETKVRRVDTSVVKEIFSVEEVKKTIEVRPKAVALFVNGNSKGVVDVGNETIASFAVAQAERAGIRSFSVYVDGRKVDTSEGNAKLAGAAKLEIVAKDARG